MLADVTVLEVTARIAERFGQVQAGLLDARRPAPAMDLLNGAVALVHDLTLMTHNVQDYAGIPGLRVVDRTVP